MEQLLAIRSNDKNWSQEEQEAILVRSVDIYLEKRRKKRLTAASEPQAKWQKTAEQDSSNEDLSESEDAENYSIFQTLTVLNMLKVILMMI